MNDRLTSDSNSHVQVLLAYIRPFVRVSLPTGIILRATGHCDPGHLCGSAINGRLRNCIRLVRIPDGHVREHLRWSSLESYTSRNAGQIPRAR